MINKPFEHSKGLSILWGASFECAAEHEKSAYKSSPLDNWLSVATRNRPTAEALLLRPDRTILRQVFHYKIKKLGPIERIQPFGVIIRDERDGTNRRCYSTYVWKVVLDSPVFTSLFGSLEWATSIVNANAISLAVFSENSGRLIWNDGQKSGANVDTNIFASKGKMNQMDIVCWRALQTLDKKISFKDAFFYRNFTLF